MRVLIVLALLLALLPVPAAAAPPPSSLADAAFDRLWNATDRLSGGSWMWGPRSWARLQEPYAEAAGGLRWVRYYDKARMELTDPAADQRAPWFITTGLLIVEMVTGQLQLGGALLVPRCEVACPSVQRVAGDPGLDNPAPSYGEFGPLISDASGGARTPSAVGQPAQQRLVRDELGMLSIVVDPGLVLPETAGAFYDDVTSQTIPQVFLQAMERGSAPWIFAFGHPISAPYWVVAQVGGQQKDVLVQLFERRVLTYTPSNAPGWRVEMGNVGQHYYAWRYGGELAPPWDAAPAPATPVFLTYHYISRPPAGSSDLRRALSVTPEMLEAQLTALQSRGYTFISIDQLLDAQAGLIEIPRLSVVLTFDDGYTDFYTNAYPILQRLNAPATIYVPSHQIGSAEHMGWHQLAELAHSPLITVGAHTKTHAQLDQVSESVARAEIVESKTTLEKGLGMPVVHFCYPYGKYTSAVRAIVEGAGFRSATTTALGRITPRDDLYTLRRVSVRQDDGVDGLLGKLRGVGAAP